MKNFRRFFAAIIDLSLIIGLLQYVNNFFSFDALFLLFAPLLQIPIETLMMTCFGTTPGKILLGIKLCTTQQSTTPLSLFFKRSIKKALFTYSMLIPGLNIFFLYRFVNKRQHHDWNLRLGIREKYSQTHLPFRFTVSAMTLIYVLQIFHTKNHAEQIISFPQEFSQIDQKDKWKHFSPTGNAFELDFPYHLPTFAFQEFPIPKSQDKLPYFEYKTNIDQEVASYYSISSTALPAAWTKYGPKLLLKGAIKILVENLPGAKIVQSTVHGANGYPVLDYKLRQNGNDVIGRLYLIGNELYRLEASFPPNFIEQHRSDISTFINSFNYIPKDKRALLIAKE